MVQAIKTWLPTEEIRLQRQTLIVSKIQEDMNSLTMTSKMYKNLPEITFQKETQTQL